MTVETLPTADLQPQPGRHIAPLAYGASFGPGIDGLEIPEPRGGQVESIALVLVDFVQLLINDSGVKIRRLASEGGATLRIAGTSSLNHRHLQFRQVVPVNPSSHLAVDDAACWRFIRGRTKRHEIGLRGH